MPHQDVTRHGDIVTFTVALAMPDGEVAWIGGV